MAEVKSNRDLSTPGLITAASSRKTDLAAVSATEAVSSEADIPNEAVAKELAAARQSGDLLHCKQLCFILL